MDNNGHPSLLRSLGVQRRVLYALMMREVITRFGRQNLGVLWVFVEPMIFTLGVAAIWTAAGLHHSSSIPIIAFAVIQLTGVGVGTEPPFVKPRDAILPSLLQTQW